MITDTDIVELVITKNDALQLQKDLTACIDALFTDTALVDILNEHIAYDTKEKLITLMRMHTIPGQDKSQIQQFFQHLLARLQEIPLLSITLAFAPKQPLIASLSAWAVAHAKKAVLLDIYVDATIMGGAIMTYNGMYKDYSLKKTIKEKYRKGELHFEI